MDDVRYVTKRTTTSGRVIHYWQRKPYPLTKLSDDLTKRKSEAAELNSLADKLDAQRRAHPENIEGSFAWCAKKYQESQKFIGLAPGTKSYYQRHLDNMVREFGPVPVGEFSRKALVDFIDKHSESQHRHIAAVASKVFQIGQRHDHTEINPTVKLDLATSQPRQEIWDADAIAAYLLRVKEHEHSRPLVVAFFTMLFTAQRPSDVLSLRRDRIGADTIVLQQKKTAAWVEIPIHTRLKPVLQYAYEVPSEYLVCDEGGNAVARSSFQYWNLVARDAAGLGHLQMRDLRRTSIVIMGEAGVPVQQIAAISGHSIATVEHIMRVYMPRTKFMAEAAIKTWESVGSARLTGINTQELRYAQVPPED